MDRRRQNRVSVSCKECRTRKLRCDRARPCARCVQAGRETRCFYDSSSRPVDGQLVFTVDRQRASNQPASSSNSNNSSDRTGVARGPLGHPLAVHATHAPHTAHAHYDGQSTMPPSLPMGAPSVGSRISSSPAPGSTSTMLPALVLRSPSLDVPQRRASPEPGGSVTQLQMLWHGSRSVDTYTEPVHGRTISTPKEVMFGENDATVYWGRTHETNFVPRITDVTRFLIKPEAISTIGTAATADGNDANDSHEVSTLLHVERNTRPGETVPVRLHDPELRALLPPRPDVDNLVDRYLHIFEAQYKIIHVPTFRREYARCWSADPVESDYGPPTFLAQLLSICAIGSAFVTTAVVTPSAKLTTMENYAATRAGQWIEAVRLWLFKQDPRMQMTLGHLQAHLLMLVAGDVHWIKIDRSWISSGMLVRNAISAGLHREPSDFTRIAPFYAEMRRRLWYAILEFDLQASFAKGRTPFVREDDFDCQPPLAIYDDVFLSEEMSEQAIKLVAQQSAKTSMSAATGPATPVSNNGSSQSLPPVPLYVYLARTIALRAQVCRTVNGIRLIKDYGQVLQLDAKLQDFVARADCATGSDSADDTSRGKSVFLRILTRRATIALHAPFLPRALYDARYLYSRKLCVETATTVLTEALSLLDGGTAELALIFAVINNICRCEISNSVFLLCHDLLAQAVKRRRIHQQMAVAMSSDPEWQQEKLRLTSVADLIERTAHATSAICKPDIVSQRTCAWMQLSAELSRAAVGDDTMTAAVMKESIGRSIQAYQASIHQQAGPIDATAGLNEADATFFSHLTGSDTLLDDDYFNLFFNLNNFDMAMANQWL
ncbi:c6 zinc finger domain-containing protein [Ophiostoma piceae UAMH 11346]|uniref:C6 zinc finger domain-containing protein n=1 Tax=Ophiostoma piceae (strain UAMH 11346) TaxID=1262450 RepID=S3CJD4_OPHP1|nr:c6 zinc finger domain-containing protein [Ophiostoma piceae UAMH 11346]